MNAGIFRVVPAIERHAHLVASNMRARDREEIRDGWEMEPEAAIIECLTKSYLARTAYLGLEILAIYGLSPITVLGRTSQVWCFGTTAIDEHPLVFARASKRELADLHHHASLLTNLVDVNDSLAMKWLAFLGATRVLQPERRGARLFGQFILAGAERQRCRQA